MSLFDCSLLLLLVAFASVRRPGMIEDSLALIQYVGLHDTDGIYGFQQGKFLYLGRAVDGTILTPLSAIASKQSSPTEDTLHKPNTF